MSEEEQRPSAKELPFHEHARDQLTQQIRSYGQELVRESVDAARARKHPLVQRRDVQFAAHRLHTEIRDRTNMLLQIVGAGLVGIFLQGFAIEMLGEAPNPWAVVVYVVVGFTGLFGVFWSLIR
jgi:uncharacterized membrane protein YuzA (DUF378 family)